MSELNEQTVNKDNFRNVNPITLGSDADQIKTTRNNNGDTEEVKAGTTAEPIDKELDKMSFGQKQPEHQQETGSNKDNSVIYQRSSGNKLSALKEATAKAAAVTTVKVETTKASVAATAAKVTGFASDVKDAAAKATGKEITPRKPFMTKYNIDKDFIVTSSNTGLAEEQKRLQALAPGVTQTVLPDGTVIYQQSQGGSINTADLYNSLNGNRHRNAISATTVFKIPSATKYDSNILAPLTYNSKEARAAAFSLTLLAMSKIASYRFSQLQYFSMVQIIRKAKMGKNEVYLPIISLDREYGDIEGVSKAIFELQANCDKQLPLRVFGALKGLLTDDDVNQVLSGKAQSTSANVLLVPGNGMTATQASFESAFSSLIGRTKLEFVPNAEGWGRLDILMCQKIAPEDSVLTAANLGMFDCCDFLGLLMFSCMYSETIYMQRHPRAVLSKEWRAFMQVISDAYSSGCILKSAGWGTPGQGNIAKAAEVGASSPSSPASAAANVPKHTAQGFSFNRIFEAANAIVASKTCDENLQELCETIAFSSDLLRGLLMFLGKYKLLLRVIASVAKV